jgi:hypothetical protein
MKLTEVFGLAKSLRSWMRKLRWQEPLPRHQTPDGKPDLSRTWHAGQGYFGNLAVMSMKRQSTCFIVRLAWPSQCLR